MSLVDRLFQDYSFEGDPKIICIFSGDEVKKLHDTVYGDIPIHPTFQYLFCKGKESEVIFPPKFTIVLTKEENQTPTISYFSPYYGEHYWVDNSWIELKEEEFDNLLEKNKVYVGGDGKKFLHFLGELKKNGNKRKRQII